MSCRRVAAGVRSYKAEEKRLAFLCVRRAALALAIRHLEDYKRLRAKRVAAGILKVA
jgi:hypothetical protein